MSEGGKGSFYSLAKLKLQVIFERVHRLGQNKMNEIYKVIQVKCYCIVKHSTKQAMTLGDHNISVPSGGHCYLHWSIVGHASCNHATNCPTTENPDVPDMNAQASVEKFAASSFTIGDLRSKPLHKS